MSILQEHDKEKFVHSLFSTIAHRYDLLNSVLSFNQDGYWRRFTVEQVSPKAGSCCLDVCCGTGKLTMSLAAKVGAQGRVIGLDFCESMLEIADENIAKSPYQASIDLVEGNAMCLPFPNGIFDCATIGFGLRNVPNIQQALSEMRRVVKPGGKIVSLELAKPQAPLFKHLYYFYFEQLLPLLGRFGIGHSWPYRWLPESLRQLPDQLSICKIFQAAGLQQVRYHELTGGIAAVYVGFNGKEIPG